MEKPETQYKQQSRRKSQIGYPGGANIGGLVLAGGALAVASFVAFALHRGKRKGGSGSGSDTNGRRQTPEKKESEQGLGFVIQNSPSTLKSNSCCSGNGSIKVVATQTIACELVATDMIKEQMSASSAIQCNCREEITEIGKDCEKVLPSDDPKKDGIESCEYHGDNEEFSMPKLENNENGSLMEVTGVVKEGKPMDAVEGKNAEITSSTGSVVLEEKIDIDVKWDDHKEAAVVKQAKEELAFVETNGEDDYDDTGFVKATDAVEAKKTDITSSMPSVIEEEKYDIDVDKDNHKEEEEEEEAAAAAVVKEAKEELDLVEISGENYSDNNSLVVERDLIDSTSKTSTHSVTEKEENKVSFMEKDEDNLQGVEGSHIGSQAEENLPVEPLSQETTCTLQHSVPQIMEEQQSKTIKLDNGKTDPLYNSRNNYQTTQKSMSLRKDETNLSRWIIQVRHVVVLLLAFMVLLLFTNQSVLSFSYS